MAQTIHDLLLTGGPEEPATLAVLPAATPRGRHRSIDWIELAVQVEPAASDVSLTAGMYVELRG
ncbi:hypothetical protein [Nonomuraea sp. NPDC049480]|uniref:hypothetical protein n=1 Tax=Nonomuraea sp. NPDC049480 TaxID=3364353 RepID=UPI0037A1743A